MSNWNQEKYIQAWNYASHAHNGQLLPGTSLPYINHIGLVAMEAMAVISSETRVQNSDLLLQCALLHDVIEDTEKTYDNVAEQFGINVADGVLALSKNSTLSGKTKQMQDSLERIKQQPKEIWMVKLSDRITNLQPPPSHWNQNKINSYREEAKVILEQLGSASQFLATRLELKISAYR
ncbi:MAG: HD domain-containing protein [Gammaproteobacteria bacterium]|nr:HD domain-containing protein [Gammaproteobacteria bacterium]